MLIRDRVKELRRVKASELLPDPRNWRTHPQAQRDALRGALAEVGMADALLARETPQGLMLIDGHARAEEAPDAEWPVLVLDVSAEEAAKLLASLDPLTGMAEADEGKLAALLAEIDFESEALRVMLDGLREENGLAEALPEPGAGGDEFDATPEETGPTRTQSGELWVIGGKHRLLVGDCTDPANVARLMGGERVGLCFTSPPYAQQRDYGAKIDDWDALMQGAFACLPMTEDGQVLVNLGLVHKDGEWVPYWDGWIEWMRAQGWKRFGWYVWDQGPGLPGDWSGRFSPAFEFLFHFNREASRPCKFVECKMAGQIARGRTFRNTDGSLDQFTSNGVPVGDTKIPDSVVRVQRQSGSDGHPAQFPVGLPAFVLQAWPRCVYDPFLGSGTTLVAAHRLGRVCYGCELEPRYCDLILKRAEAEGLTCEKAG